MERIFEEMMITVTIETDKGEHFSRAFPGDSFEIAGNDTQRLARAGGNSAIVSCPRDWEGRRCVVVSILERTQRDTPENEPAIRGIK